MTKFREGEIVRSVLKGDEKFPFFEIVDPGYQNPFVPRLPGAGRALKQCLVRSLRNQPPFFNSVRSESALRHTEKDSAGDE